MNTGKQHLWVIGSGGLLGSAIQRSARHSGDFEVFTGPNLNWKNPEALMLTLESSFREFLELAAHSGREWSVVWAAGASVIGASADSLAKELENFNSIFAMFREVLSQRLQADRGRLFLASSAGGIYGGSNDVPCSEHTPPMPISPYGENRLAMEKLASIFSKNTGVKLIIGRIANLYGPGQNLEKTQGIISQLIRSQFTRRPLSIFVPLDTRRDYIFVDDCARITLACLKNSNILASPDYQVTKIIASGSSVSIAHLLGLVRQISKKPVHVLVGSSPLRTQHSLEIPLRSEVWPDLNRLAQTSLSDGISRTFADALIKLQGGSIT